MDSLHHNQDDDEFQFRPLTEGLGFHKKPESTTGIKTAKSAAATAALQNLNPDLELTPPLPRKNFGLAGMNIDEVSKPSVQSKTAVDEILKTLQDNKKLNLGENKNIIHQKSVVTFKPAQIEFSASLLDAMLVTAASLLCLIITLLVTKVDFMANLYHPDHERLVYLALLSLFAGTAWIYLVINRIFLGFTPGEWVFDQRLGQPDQMGTNMYALKVLARATVTVITGGIIFPLLSMIFNRDLLGQALGLQLYKKV